MPYSPTAEAVEPTREELDRSQGPLLVEFGAEWCPICQGFAPKLEELFEQFPQVRHIKIEDGKGRPLGRSFGVKLWPTLVFLRDGEVQDQVARPSVVEARAGLEAIAGPTE
jgi:thioredoxin 1